MAADAYFNDGWKEDTVGAVPAHQSTVTDPPPPPAFKRRSLLLLLPPPRRRSFSPSLPALPDSQFERNYDGDRCQNSAQNRFFIELTIRSRYIST